MSEMQIAIDPSSEIELFLWTNKNKISFFPAMTSYLQVLISV